MLKVRNLSKEFLIYIRGNKKIISLENISFALKKGEFLGLSGPSGIGKSTLLKCIYRTYIPTNGEVIYRTVDGDVINLATADEHTILDLREREIGYISQFLHVIPRVSALGVVASTLVLKGLSRTTSEERAGEYLRRVGIPQALWEMYPSTFSGGEKQRLNIVHAIITRPRLLLLDEPTASLDAKTKREVISLIKELKSDGTSMIGVFHDQDTMKILSDKQFNLESDCYKEACV